MTLSPTPSTESQNGGGSPKNAAAVAAALGGGAGAQSAVTSIHHLFPSPVNANGGGGGARSKLASTSSLASQVRTLSCHRLNEMAFHVVQQGLLSSFPRFFPN